MSKGLFGDDDEEEKTGNLTTEHTENTEKEKEREKKGIEVEVEVEAVINGCLQRVKLKGMNPAKTHEWLKSLDPGVKVRDDFPKGGMGGKFGARECKTATAVMMIVKKNGDYKGMEITCAGAAGEEDVTVAVSKKEMEEVVQKLAGLPCLFESPQLDKVSAILTGGKDGTATVILEAEKRFKVEYWTTEKGQHYLQGVAAL